MLLQPVHVNGGNLLAAQISSRWSSCYNKQDEGMHPLDHESNAEVNNSNGPLKD